MSLAKKNHENNGLSVHAQKLRLFIAIHLSGELKDYLWTVIEKLYSEGDDIKWVPKENLHLSIKFLGDTDELEIPAIESALARAVLKLKSFNITTDDINTFGKISRPKVIYCAIKECPPLEELKNIIEYELEKIGFERDTKKFTPHITMARIKSTSNLYHVENMMAHKPKKNNGKPLKSTKDNGKQLMPPITMEVLKVRLMISEISGAGAPPVYKKLKSLSFS